MELVLIENVPGLGTQGDLVQVATGYANNYLLPRKLAAVPTEQTIRAAKAKAERAEAQKEAEKAERMDFAKTLATAHVRLKMKASEEGNLYGSVGPKQIVEALAEMDHEVEEKQVALEAPLKSVGDYDVTIALHAEVAVPIKVTIESEDDE